MAGKDYRPDLGDIGCPSLVIHGSESALYPAEVGIFMAEELGAERVEMPGSGHSPQLEDPDRFNQVLSDFMGRI